MQIKATRKYSYLCLQPLKSKTTNIEEDEEHWKDSTTDSTDINWYSHFGNV